MIRALLLSTLFATSAGWAQSVVEAEKKKDALASLPVGATLTKFSHPRYGQDQKALSLLTADKMVISSEEQFTGYGLVLRLFDSDQKVSARASMDSASFWIEKEQVEAFDNLLIRATDDKFLAQGTGGLVHLETQQGLLNGPARTLFTLPSDKRTSSAPMKPSLPLLLATLPLLTAAPPVPMTAEELAAFEEAVLPPKERPQMDSFDLGEFERKVATRDVPNFNFDQEMAIVEMRDLALTQRLKAFLQSTSRLHLLSQVSAPPAKVLPESELFISGDKRIVIEAERGAYFDSQKQEFVYLGKVKLSTTGITMTCNDGMKAILSQPADDPQKPKGKKEKLSAFGDLLQVTASGGVVVQGTDKKGQPLEARADRALFDNQSKTLILRGKNMFYRSGEYAVRTKDPKAATRIKLLGKNQMDAAFDGKWDFGLPIEKPKK